ncbi:SAM-dependent methyltransferase [Saccharopolyspora dendranthemae]|uniref:S-adenosyl methyltransferase n=1 Tax=Saccharopolyspora dendranthemae TaxID=1181886 RepID=A0A561U7X7_9PSEU|nr:SAM-dependent methyltransferase [Saccharopolyspora dendranthemae]TWF95453.1 S-adenosyl methyltransferase [Saccharopolyspora dendranthemae]
MSSSERRDMPTDTSQPSAARAYDYFLGGNSNFAADRDFAEQVKAIAPSVPNVARLNRNFLRRVVQYSLDQGIRQFLDLGSGIPTVGNTHQIADAAGIDARVVYVDSEPVAYHHSRSLLGEHPNATIIQTDMRDRELVLGHPETQRLLDFSQPMALLVVGVLLYLPDPEPIELIRGYREHLAAGSLVAVSTLTDEHAAPALRDEIQRLRAAYADAGEPVYPRDHAELVPWFEGTTLVEPGLVTLPEWHCDDLSEFTDVASTLGYGAVARIH